jgi:ketosteroid isomerase-like protein
MKVALIIASAILVVASACSHQGNTPVPATTAYIPDDQKLYNTVVQLDSLFFAAYNSCDVNLATYASFYADSIEFYHDKGGLSTSKKEVVDGTEKNVCGKVRRELVKGSIEVYPIKDYGAIEMGMHIFHNNTEKQSSPPHAGKFVIVWQNKNNEWKIKRVISLH